MSCLCEPVCVTSLSLIVRLVFGLHSSLAAGFTGYWQLALRQKALWRRHLSLAANAILRLPAALIQQRQPTGARLRPTIGRLSIHVTHSN